MNERAPWKTHGQIPKTCIPVSFPDTQRTAEPPPLQWGPQRPLAGGYRRGPRGASAYGGGKLQDQWIYWKVRLTAHWWVKGAPQGPFGDHWTGHIMRQEDTGGQKLPGKWNRAWCAVPQITRKIQCRISRAFGCTTKCSPALPHKDFKGHRPLAGLSGAAPLTHHK